MDVFAIIYKYKEKARKVRNGETEKNEKNRGGGVEG